MTSDHPTVERGSAVSPTEIVRRLAARNLPGALPLVSPAPSQGLSLVREAQRSHLLGPLDLAVRAGEVELPESAVAELHEARRAVMWWCLIIEERLLDLRERFDEAGGVEHLVIKGSAVAHLDEDDPSQRSFADLDLLVAGHHIERAVEVLTAMGATRPWAERRPGYDRRFAKSVTMTCVDGVEIDMHRSLCDGVHGFRIPIERLFAHQTSYQLGGHSVGALSLQHRVLHAAYHAVLGSPEPKLSSLRDLGRYLSRPDVSVADLAAEAEVWRGTAVLAEAVRVTISTLGLDLPQWSTWATTVDVPPREAAIVDGQRLEGSSYGPGKLAALREIRGPGDRVAYLSALVLPSGEHLRSRGLRRRDLLGRSVRRVRPRGGG